VIAGLCDFKAFASQHVAQDFGALGLLLMRHRGAPAKVSGRRVAQLAFVEEGFHRGVLVYAARAVSRLIPAISEPGMQCRQYGPSIWVEHCKFHLPDQCT
jgi:hypothetical protein